MHALEIIRQRGMAKRAATTKRKRKTFADWVLTAQPGQRRK